MTDLTTPTDRDREEAYRIFGDEAYAIADAMLAERNRNA